MLEPTNIDITINKFRVSYVPADAWHANRGTVMMGLHTKLIIFNPHSCVVLTTFSTSTYHDVRSDVLQVIKYGASFNWHTRDFQLLQSFRSWSKFFKIVSCFCFISCVFAPTCDNHFISKFELDIGIISDPRQTDWWHYWVVSVLLKYKNSQHYS